MKTTVLAAIVVGAGAAGAAGYLAYERFAATAPATAPLPAVTEAPPAQLAATLPAFQLADRDGQMRSLADWQGKALIVNFYRGGLSRQGHRLRRGDRTRLPAADRRTGGTRRRRVVRRRGDRPAVHGLRGQAGPYRRGTPRRTHRAGGGGDPRCRPPGGRGGTDARTGARPDRGRPRGAAAGRTRRQLTGPSRLGLKVAILRRLALILPSFPGKPPPPWHTYCC